MGLQTDAEGNLYYAKAARHGLTAVVPQHGTLLQDRQGRRADRDPGDRLPRPQRRLPEPRRHLLPHRPGGVLDPQEPDQLGQAGRLLRQHVGLSRRHGHLRRGDGAAGLLDHQRLRPLAGRAGPGRERPSGLGAAARVAARTSRTATARSSWCRTRSSAAGCRAGCARCRSRRSPTGIMRGRFHPGRRPALRLRPVRLGRRPDPARRLLPHPRHRQADVRAGRPARPEGRHGDHVHRTARPQGRRATRRTTRARTWSLKRTVNYGSDHIDEQPARIAAAKVSDDGRTVFLEIPDIRPTWCMEITYAIRGESGEAVEGAIDNTIHQLGD